MSSDYKIVFLDYPTYTSLEKALGHLVQYVDIQPDELVDKHYVAILIGKLCFVPSKDGLPLFTV